MAGARLYRDQGIVLRAIKLGEADRIVTILTAEHGKVRAVAKGVRKTTSRLGARVEPARHVALQLYEGRELDTITQAETIEHFREIRDDLDRLTRAVALCEAADQLAPEREPHPRLYQMLLGALRTLAAQPAPAVVGAFYLKLLAAEGNEPLLDACAVCGTEIDLVAFDLDHGGVLCRGCRGSAPGASPVSAGGLLFMRRVLGGDLVSILAEPPSPVLIEVEHVATRALESHVERRLRAVRLLGTA